MRFVFTISSDEQKSQGCLCFNVSEFEDELVREFHRVLAEVRQQHPELFRQSQSTGQGPRRVSTGASGGGETQSPSRVRVADVGSDSVGVTPGEAAVQACGAQLEVSRGDGTGERPRFQAEEREGEVGDEACF